jgi:formyl-CoA transferase
MRRSAGTHPHDMFQAPDQQRITPQVRRAARHPGHESGPHTPIRPSPLISARACRYLTPTTHKSGVKHAMGPLQGIRVIDMTTVLMGPYATQMLGDYGADVIKVESLDGDVTRLIGPTRHPGMGPVFLNTNRNKRSIALDLKKPAGREAVLRLIESADVLIYNVRPQAMARLDLGYEAVSKRNPRLIYAGVFGFGQNGPYAAKPAYDDLIQGATGLPALMAQTSDGMPRYVPNALVDRIVGLTAVGAVCASLVHRDRTGHGQRVDIPMFETMAGFVLGDHLGGLTYEPHLDKGGYARHLSRDRRPYKTSDGYICVIVYNDKQWESFFKATGRDDLRQDPKFATFAGRSVNIDTVYGELARIFETRSTAEWQELLTKADVPVMPMHDLESMLEDPHLVATGYFPVVEHPTEGAIRSMKVSASWSETPAETVRLAPRLNEHGEELLRSAGFSADEIAAMIRDGVTRPAA